MAKLSAAQRNALPASAFGLPGTRQYPIEDKAHARNALARASEEFQRGVITAAQRDEIVSRADKVLGK